MASITHVAHVTITSRISTSNCAYKASYSDGLIKSADGKPIVRPCAGTLGTTITIENLFHNMQIRRQSLKSPSDEYQRILDVVIKYSIHYSDKNVTLSCKKLGSKLYDLPAVNGDCLECIKNIYGSDVSKELIPVSNESSVANDLDVTVKGFITSTNYSGKKIILILFINHRLVNCIAIKKVVEAVYSELLMKHHHPFVYLSLRYDTN